MVMCISIDNVFYIPPFSRLYGKWRKTCNFVTNNTKSGKRKFIIKIPYYLQKICICFLLFLKKEYFLLVVKRSADLHSEARFAQFAGKGITEFDIVNLDEVIAYENKINSH